MFWDMRNIIQNIPIKVELHYDSKRRDYAISKKLCFKCFKLWIMDMHGNF